MSEEILAEIRKTRQLEANNIAARQAAAERHRVAYDRWSAFNAELEIVRGDVRASDGMLRKTLWQTFVTIVGCNADLTPGYTPDGERYKSPVRAITAVSAVLAGMADVAASFGRHDRRADGFDWFYATARVLGHNLRELEAGAPAELFQSMAHLGVCRDWGPNCGSALHFEGVSPVEYHGVRRPLDVASLLRDPAFKVYYTKAKSFVAEIMR